MTCRTIKPKHNAPRAQHQNRIAKAAADADPLAIFNLLSSRELGEVMEQHLPAHRERHFPPRVTLAMFIGQALSEDGSLQRAVDQWAVQSARAGVANFSTHTGAYNACCCIGSVVVKEIDCQPDARYLRRWGAASLAAPTRSHRAAEGLPSGL